MKLNKDHQEKVIKMTESQLNEFSSIDLLTELGKRITNKEIEGLNTDYSSLQVRKYPRQAISSENDNKAIFILHLSTGETEKKF